MMVIRCPLETPAETMTNAASKPAGLNPLKKTGENPGMSMDTVSPSKNLTMTTARDGSGRLHVMVAKKDREDIIEAAIGLLTRFGYVVTKKDKASE